MSFLCYISLFHGLYPYRMHFTHFSHCTCFSFTSTFPMWFSSVSNSQVDQMLFFPYVFFLVISWKYFRQNVVRAVPRTMRLCDSFTVVPLPIIFLKFIIESRILFLISMPSGLNVYLGPNYGPKFPIPLISSFYLPICRSCRSRYWRLECKWNEIVLQST